MATFPVPPVLPLVMQVPLIAKHPEEILIPAEPVEVAPVVQPREKKGVEVAIQAPVVIEVKNWSGPLADGTVTITAEAIKGVKSIAPNIPKIIFFSILAIVTR